jgi:DNA-binding CsgD family transcriptional regulator
MPDQPCTGMLVDISDPARPRVRLAAGGSEEDADALRCLIEVWPRSSARGFVRRLFDGARCFTVSGRLDEFLFQRWCKGMRGDRDVRDAFCVGACHSPGEGVLLWFPLQERTRVSRRALSRWDLVAQEILKGLRGRHDADDEGSLPKSARVPLGVRRHEGGDVGSMDAAALRVAVRAALDAVAVPGAPAAGAAEPFRSELMAGRWHLLDHFDAEGRHYFAWERSEKPPERTRALTVRERAVLQRVASGLGDRAIAMDFGCSASTVATHRLRAMSKLGIGSRTVLAQVLAGIGRLEG